MSFRIFIFTCWAVIIFGCNTSKPSLVSIDSNLKTTKTQRNTFLKESTFYGLQKDRFPQELAAQLLENQANWVTKCPICDHVKNGFSLYANSNFKNKKTKLTRDAVTNLSSDDETVRKIALRDLIDHYVRQYYSALDMSPAQRNHMEQQLSEGRKAGMEVANGGVGFFCSSCDGACHIKN